MAATIGLVQNDIKKVYAYSTVSQLGYMFLACGVGAFSAGIFHVVTHAFFKALLFLGAGSVIHAFAANRTCERWAGLRKKTPITFWTMLCAPRSRSPGSRSLPAASARMRSSWRHIITPLDVLGRCGHRRYDRVLRIPRRSSWRSSESIADDQHPHESPLVMTAPLMVLALLSLVGGFIPVPHFLEPMFPQHGRGAATALLGYIARRPDSSASAGVPVLRCEPALADSMATNVQWPLSAGSTTSTSWMKPTTPRWSSRWCRARARVLWRGVESGVIDGIVNGMGRRSRNVGSVLRRLQSGNIRSYAAWVVLGSVVVIVAHGPRGRRSMNLLDLVLFLPADRVLLLLLLLPKDNVDIIKTCDARASLSSSSSRLWLSIVGRSGRTGRA